VEEKWKREDRAQAGAGLGARWARMCQYHHVLAKQVVRLRHIRRDAFHRRSSILHLTTSYRASSNPIGDKALARGI
jgi:hypothetical protein